MTDLEYGYTQEANIRGGGKNQRHIIRYRRPGTTVCPGCWAMGTHKVKEVRIKMFCTGLTRAAEAGKKIYFTGTMSQIHQPSKDPFLLYFISLHLPQFQQSGGATHPSLVSLKKQFTWFFKCPEAYCRKGWRRRSSISSHEPNN